MKNKFLTYVIFLGALSTLTVGCNKDDDKNLEVGSITDSRDGNVYKWVKIGSQIWMAENLKYLPSVSASTEGSQTEPHYYVYGYNGTDVTTAKATDNYKTYGVLYNWAAAMNGENSSNTIPSGVQGICPEGWHLPSVEEWKQLINYLGGEEVAGGKLKEIGTINWTTPNTRATNETGFTAIPGGSRSNEGTFLDIGNFGTWHHTGERYDFRSGPPKVSFNNSNISSSRIDLDAELGFSCRCLKD
jgi:uncharacterized protein (TIGR02145 family)